jgi:ABC-2 type transport system ATP-binding protein
MDVAVRLESVRKTFGDFVAVDDLSLDVPVGSIHGFIGPNGSGKTTTLRMIVRIYPPDRGRVIVLGRELHGPANEDVGYLPEERGIYSTMKVADVLKFYARIRGHRPTTSEVNALLDRVGLSGWGGKSVRQLSKGMTQKVQFLATVIGRPRLLLLDEPFSGLDPVNAVLMRDLIQELRREGSTIIFSTHDMRVAEEMCDTVFMIYKGKKVLDGTLTQIKREYGRDVLRVRMHDAQGGLMRDLPGVMQVSDFGAIKELRMTAEADPQRILKALVERGTVDHFEITSPSLQDIFVRIAAPQGEGLSTMG